MKPNGTCVVKSRQCGYQALPPRPQWNRALTPKRLFSRLRPTSLSSCRSISHTCGRCTSHCQDPSTLPRRAPRKLAAPSASAPHPRHNDFHPLTPRIPPIRQKWLPYTLLLAARSGRTLYVGTARSLPEKSNPPPPQKKIGLKRAGHSWSCVDRDT